MDQLESTRPREHIFHPEEMYPLKTNSIRICSALLWEMRHSNQPRNVVRASEALANNWLITYQSISPGE